MAKTNGNGSKIKKELVKEVFGKVKRKLSPDQEFQIMKLVLDKFLWLGLLIMLFGLFTIYNSNDLTGFFVLIGGAFVWIIFIWILMREYEIAKF